MTGDENCTFTPTINNDSRTISRTSGKVLLINILITI